MPDGSPYAWEVSTRCPAQLIGAVAVSLRCVYDFRLATAVQLQRLLSPSTSESDTRASRRRLERLTRIGAVRRLDRRIGGVRAGSASFIYAIGPVGERILRTTAPRRRLAEPSWAFVDHTLAVTQFFIQITEQVRQIAGAELIAVETEPTCWRSFTALGAGQELRPDLLLVLGIGDLEHRWWIEVDRASEHLPAVLRKCSRYELYYRSGLEQQAHGVFPRVMWATTTPERADAIARRLVAAGSTAELFNVDTFDRAVRRTLGVVE